jgi:hypothetical protein
MIECILLPVHSEDTFSGWVWFQGQMATMLVTFCIVLLYNWMLYSKIFNYLSLWKKNQENQTFFLSVDWSVKKNYIVKRSQLICLTMQGDIMIIINTAKSIKCKVSNFKYTTYIINMQKMSIIFFYWSIYWEKKCLIFLIFFSERQVIKYFTVKTLNLWCH